MEFFHILILCIPLLSYVQGSERIIGGVTVTNRKNFAHQASIQNKGAHICGGAIVNLRHVLTAASCTEVQSSGVHPKSIPSGDLTVVVGNLKLHDDSDAIVKKVEYVFAHENYDPGTKDNNLAVIRLTEELKESTTVGVINLAGLTPAANTNAFISGWGTFTEDQPGPNENLRAVSIPIVGQDVCNAVFRQLTNRMFCAGTRKLGFCDGDIGGPLVCEGPTLCGIASYTQTNCASATDILGVYVDISKYGDWTTDKFTKKTPWGDGDDDDGDGMSSRVIASLSILICMMVLVFLC